MLTLPVAVPPMLLTTAEPNTDAGSNTAGGSFKSGLASVCSGHRYSCGNANLLLVSANSMRAVFGPLPALLPVVLIALGLACALAGTGRRWRNGLATIVAN